MSLRQTLQDAQKTAMKNGDKETLSTLRVLWSALRNTEIDKGQELNDEETEQLITRQVKQLKDAISEFEKGGRTDLVEQSQKEIAVLSQYLPQQLSDDELMNIVKTVSANIVGEKNTGALMGAIMKEVKGKADGNRVRQCLEKLAGS